MKVRKSLHPLQVAAGDKENLVGAGRMTSAVADKDLKAASLNSKVQSGETASPAKDPKIKSKSQEKRNISVEDLTSEAGPSENYWQALAETRRKALEKTLAENQQLHETIEKLKEENKRCHELLSEAQDVIDTFNEILAEVKNENPNASPNSSNEGNNDTSPEKNFRRP